MDDDCYIVVVDEEVHADSKLNVRDIKVKLEKLEWLEDETNVDEEAREELIRILEGNDDKVVSTEIKVEDESDTNYSANNSESISLEYDSDSDQSSKKKKKRRPSNRPSRSRLAPCNIKIVGNLEDERRVLQPCFIKIIERPEHEIKTVRPATKKDLMPPVVKIPKPKQRGDKNKPKEKRCRKDVAPSLCPICSKFVKDLTKHLKLHDANHKYKAVNRRKEDVYYCGHCSATYRSRQGLEAHENAHVNNRPYKCSFCERAYTSNTALRQHIKQHYEFRFVCPICGKKSPRKDSFKLHMKIHDGKTYKCDECPKAFVLPTQLRVHKKRDHSDDTTKDKCCFCGTVFKKFANLRRHMLKSHGYNVISKKMFFNELPTLKNENENLILYDGENVKQELDEVSFKLEYDVKVEDDVKVEVSEV